MFNGRNPVFHPILIEQVLQASLSIYLAITVEVIGIGEVGVGLTRGGGYDFLHISVGEAGECLQPTGYDAADLGGGHAGARLGIPGILALLEQETLDIVFALIGGRISLGIIAVEGSYDILTGAMTSGFMSPANEGPTLEKVPRIPSEP